MRMLLASLSRAARCEAGAITTEFVVLTAGVVLLVVSVFGSLAPGGGLNTAVATLLLSVGDKMTEADFSN